MTTLDTDERTILTALAELDPAAEYQFNAWHPVFEKATRAILRIRPALDSLKRRGLITAEGRGTARQYGITEAGLEAVDRPKQAS